MEYNTEILPVTDPNALKKAAELLEKGELVAIPTETVYGLAANALDSSAVSRIFTVKGRPQDNPLIVHLSGFETVSQYAKLSDIDDNDLRIITALSKDFMPGPLTVILPKSEIIPDVTSGGLNTVGIRVPDVRGVRELINQTGFPLAAPSANISGKPSPTTAKHVYDDLCGKIPLILDGGVCTVGLESTVISIINGTINILRPGKVTAEALSEYAEVRISEGVLNSLSDTQTAISPGMKYKHYAPSAAITVIDGDTDDFFKYFNEHSDNDTFALMFDNDPNGIIPDIRRINYGKNETEQGIKLFSVLRELDELGIKRIFARCPEKTGPGLAVYNRLIRAAGFNIVKMKKTQ